MSEEALSSGANTGDESERARAHRHSNGRFAKGNPGGPGRPRGTALSRSALALDELGADVGRELMNVVVEQAKAGNLRAAELVLSRVWPARRGRPLAIDAEPLQAMADLEPASNALTEAVLKGEVTPQEGRSFASLMAMQCRLLETVDIERRVQAIEDTIEERKRKMKR